MTGSPLRDRAPHVRPPAGACDTHAHIFGPYATYPLAGVRDFVPIETPAEAYNRMHEVVGIDRGVLVQPTYYATDNTCLLDALAASRGTIKGIVVVETETLTDAEVRRLDALGVRGIRIQRFDFGPKIEDLEEVAERIEGIGWHLQIPPPSIETVVALRPRLEKLPVPVVFDQMGKPNVAEGAGANAFREFLSMIRDGVAWVKLSHAYLLAPAHPHREAVAFGAALADANIDRCIFGSDWPHQSVQEEDGTIPDDGFLLDLFAEMVPDEARRKRVLVDNPAQLFRF